MVNGGPAGSESPSRAGVLAGGQSLAKGCGDAHCGPAGSRRSPNGERQSFSERWTELAAAERIEAVAVDVHADDAMARIAECDGFMWRSSTAAQSRRVAKRLLPAVEQGMGIPVYPSWKTLWHYEDKIAQTYLLSAAGIGIPATGVFWDRQQALRYVAKARYPLRSEEHTSELQSLMRRSYAVSCLKKNTATSNR